MLLLICLCIFGVVSFSLLAIIAVNQNCKTQERISRALGKGDLPMEKEIRPLRERMLRPLLHKFANLIARWAPKGQREQISAKLSSAGLLGEWDETEWRGLQLVLGLVLALIFLALASYLNAKFLVRLEICLIGCLIGYLLPGSFLKSKAKQRLKEIEKTLPDVLDLLTISVEAGLGFDAALIKVAEKQQGVLAEEFLSVLQEIKMGRPRREALRDLARRNKTAEDLCNFIASLVQADQLGISIGGVLRNQAKQIRQKHRQRAEEKAQKAPVKMMIPLVFFVFPSIFIIVLGPAVIQIIDIFK